MNQVIIDNSLLVSACITAILMVRFTSARKAGAISSFFLLFSPLVIFLNMWAHTIAVSIVNYKRYTMGTFQFGFTFYSLILMGVVFIVVSGINIHMARKTITGNLSHVRSIHWLNLATGLLFLPVVPMNPIASLPVIASVVSSITLVLMKPFTSRLIYDKQKAVVQR
jgi:hypothetical protein